MDSLNINLKEVVMITLVAATLMDVVFWSLVGYITYLFNRELHRDAHKN